MNDIDTPAQRLVRQFGLLPHPEGGYYRETYRSELSVATEAGDHDASTAIYYLLEQGDYSAWHRIASDELWHFYAGSCLHVHVLDDHGLTTHLLGNPLLEPGSAFQVMVPAGRWFAAEPTLPVKHPSQEEGRNSFSLVGCTVAPGFEFNEFELADTQALISKHPKHADLIRQLAPAQR